MESYLAQVAAEVLNELRPVFARIADAQSAKENSLDVVAIAMVENHIDITDSVVSPTVQLFRGLAGNRVGAVQMTYDRTTINSFVPDLQSPVGLRLSAAMLGDPLPAITLELCTPWKVFEVCWLKRTLTEQLSPAVALDLGLTKAHR